MEERYTAPHYRAALVSSSTPVISMPSTRLIHVQLLKIGLELLQGPNKPQVHMVAMDSTIEIDHGKVNLAGQARPSVNSQDIFRHSQIKWLMPGFGGKLCN